jgi:hypothetical protein
MEFVRIVAGSPQPMSLRALIKAIQRETGKSLPDLGKVDKAVRDARLAKYDVYEVAVTEPPNYDPDTQQLVKSYVDAGSNNWQTAWAVEDIPTAELEAQAQAAADAVISAAAGPLRSALLTLIETTHLGLERVRDGQPIGTQAQFRQTVISSILNAEREKLGLPPI